LNTVHLLEDFILGLGGGSRSLDLKIDSYPRKSPDLEFSKFGFPLAKWNIAHKGQFSIIAQAVVKPGKEDAACIVKVNHEVIRPGPQLGDRVPLSEEEIVLSEVFALIPKV